VSIVTEGPASVNRHNYLQLGYDRVFRGVYRPAAPTSDNAWQQRHNEWLIRVRAALDLYGAMQPVLYGVTALRALGVALPHRLAGWDVVHISIDCEPRPKRSGVVAHLGLRGRTPWRVIDGLPVLNPVDHWLQIDDATDDEMIQIGDGFLRRRNPLLSLDQMQERLDQLTGYFGMKQARRVMRFVLPNTDSIYESKTRLVLVRAGLPTPAVNYFVWCPAVGTGYHLDMGYADAKVGVEFDGRDHVKDEQHMDFDIDRRRDIQNTGWIIISVTATGLRSPADFIRSVENALIMRTTRKF